MNSWCENAEVLNSTFAYLAEEERSHLGGKRRYYLRTNERVLAVLG